LNDENFIRFRDLLQDRCGLYFTPQNRQDLREGVEKAMLQAGISDLAQYYHLLYLTPTDDSLWRQLVSRVTIGETYFFRTIPHFEALRDRILPNLIEQRRKLGLRILRLWSAGCSTGEEAYTLAILLRELLEDFDQWHIYILATDINHKSLEHARQGVYTENAFRIETPEDIREKYFHYDGHCYLLASDIREMVTFAYLNLVEDIYPDLSNSTLGMDVIFCRNVTIYFSKETTRQVVKRFYDSLVDGGWLFVGHSEPLASIYTGYETHNFPNASVYRKPSATKPSYVKTLRQTGTLRLEKPLFTLEEIYRLLEKGRLNDAREALKHYLQISPRHVDALFLLAKLTANDGEIEGTHKILDTIEEIDPLLPQAHYLRALLFEQHFAPEQAKAALRRAIYADRNFVLAHYHMGELLFSEGSTVQAKRSWQMAYNMLAGKEPDALVPFGDGATVGTLLYAIKQRMGTL
jgi:chemotaxis protein methyltransferase CheR